MKSSLDWFSLMAAILVAGNCVPVAGAAEPVDGKQPATRPATGPMVSFMGMEVQGRSVIYVIDACGSMLMVFDESRVQVRRSVEALRPEQSFNIALICGSNTQWLRRDGLLPATEQNKKKAYDAMDNLSVHGMPSDDEILRIAFRQKAEQMFLFTEGDLLPSNKEIVDLCVEHTKDGKTRINTLAFISRDTKEKPEDLEFVKAMKTIAEKSGGRFRIVLEKDLASDARR